ncbi:MAG: holo-ACP synthase [Verrucomicrobia bacterium]|jgi:holo-[acyl-carrier protein] synthase|nr:holo-ACP synthase [Verrucomicrobiota bacterium]
MIFGIGVDVVETRRIAESIERLGERFLERVYQPGEIEYCRSMRAPAPHFAARFAAKEAVSKAFGTGFSNQVNWRDIEIRRKATGEPFVVLHSGAAELAKRLGIRTIFVSLSHSDEYAVANAVLVKETT